MPSSFRVRQDDSVVAYRPSGSRSDYLLGQIKSGKWRVYEDATTYTSTSGQTVIKGLAMRDVDDSIFTFPTQQDAIDWIDGGCLVSLA